jgi:hypothetical protein
MKILSHRGFWRTPTEQNTKCSITQSLNRGYGVETDLRDFMGTITIAHDPPTSSNYSLKDLLMDYERSGKDLPLALNIKADGLASSLNKELEAVNTNNLFAFDMSVPDMIAYKRHAIPFFTRQSDLEESPVLYKDAAGIWVDEFAEEWITQDVLNKHLANGKKVCIVSPELHGRDYMQLWIKLKTWKHRADNSCMICTDFPEKADNYLNGHN